MPSNTSLLLLVLVVLVVCLPGHQVYAFGAGNIPSYAHLKGHAFRHGDIEEILSDLFKKHGVTVGFMGNMIGKHKFGPIDIKRIYFGNWLRDYSQAIDIATLKQTPFQTIMNLILAFGFLAHGYATEEFEVTPQRLGTYLPVEHIDNPKGYGEGMDPRTVHPNLRPPVDPREVEFDLRTGMKNYIANDSGPWDTSKTHVRRTLQKCIELGRRYRVENPDRSDKFESYRLLGSALHTLEDFSAHSNFCELCLVSMGFSQVFTHVGDAVRVQAPSGRWVAPVVTGVFGANDFMHSLFSEASDQIASVTEMNNRIHSAHLAQSGSSGGSSFLVSSLKKYMTKMPANAELSNDLDQMQQIIVENEQSAQGNGGKRPEEMTPQEMHSRLWAILSLRDKIVKSIDRTIERVPGLRPLLDKIYEQIAVIVFVALAPLLAPLMHTATTSLQEATKEVIDSADQYEVFNNPHASDPTHSFLSKDHFDQILNEPAGHVARIIVTHTVTLVVQAWDDSTVNVNKAIDQILECLFHPDFHNPNSKIQASMLAYMYEWVTNLGSRRNSVINRLTKQSVAEHKNVRLEGEIAPNKAVSDPLGIDALTGGLAGALLPGVPGLTTSLSGPVPPAAGASAAPTHSHSHSRGHGLNNPLVSGILGGLGLGALGNLAGGIGGRKAERRQGGTRGLDNSSLNYAERLADSVPFHISVYGRGGEARPPTQQYHCDPAFPSPSVPNIQHSHTSSANQSPYAPSEPQGQGFKYQ